MPDFPGWLRTIGVATLLALVAGILLLAPFVSVSVESELVTADRHDCVVLLSRAAPLEAIQECVEDSGLHVDDIRGFGGYSLLDTAASYGREDVAVWLLEHGATVQFEHSTPLFRAVMRNNRSMVELLLQHGADPDYSPAGITLTPRRAARTIVKDDAITSLLEEAVRE